MSTQTVVTKTNVALSIKNRQDDTEYLEFIFNDKIYEFDAPIEYVHNEENKDIVALTYAAIIRIANEEKITFETLDIIKSSYNHCTVRVVAKLPDGTAREALIGKNKDNLSGDAKADADNVAHKKACVEAFLALYGLASSRFNLRSGKAAVKKGSGINLNVLDDGEPDTADEPKSNAPATVATSNTENTNEIGTDESENPHASVVMPFGSSKGQTIFSILSGEGGLGYFSRLFAVNQSIKNNTKVSDAIFAFYDGKELSEEEQKLLTNIRTAVS